MAATVLAVSIFALALLATLLALRAHRAATVPPAAPGEGVAPLSVVVAAHDEALRIPALVASLLAQDHPEFEVIVVDDRSTDGTLAAARAAAAGDPRMRFVRIDERPPGWQGRLYAQGVGVAAARLEWLLFLSADQRLVGRDFLRSLLAVYARRGLDAASVLGPFPGQRWWQTWWFRPIADNPVVLGCVFLLQRARRHGSWLIGALAMRRATYEQVGGASAAAAFGAGAFDDWGWTRVFEQHDLEAAMLYHPGLHDVSNWESLVDGWDGLSRWAAGILTSRPGAGLAALVLTAAVLGCAAATAVVVLDLLALRAPPPLSLAFAGVPLLVGAAHCRAHGHRLVWAALSAPLSLFLLLPLVGGAIARLRNRVRWRDEQVRVVAARPSAAAPAPGVSAPSAFGSSQRPEPAAAQAPTPSGDSPHAPPRAG